MCTCRRSRRSVPDRERLRSIPARMSARCSRGQKAGWRSRRIERAPALRGQEKFIPAMAHIPPDQLLTPSIVGRRVDQVDTTIEDRVQELPGLLIPDRRPWGAPELHGAVAENGHVCSCAPERAGFDAHFRQTTHGPCPRSSVDRPVALLGDEIVDARCRHRAGEVVALRSFALQVLRIASCSFGSTPSAVTCRSNASAMAMMAATSEESSGSVPRPSTNDRFHLDLVNGELDLIRFYGQIAWVEVAQKLWTRFMRLVARGPTLTRSGWD